MKKRIGSGIKKFLSCSEVKLDATASNPVDVREEYAHAFRTESYNEFWAGVQALSDKDPTSTCTVLAVESTTSAARLPSYRLFVENLLDPDQSTVIRILSLIHSRTSTHFLLSKYFTETANASLLCSLVLRDIDHVRIKYRSLKATLEQNAPNTLILTRLTEFANSPSPCYRSSRVQEMQLDCSKLLKQLESKRDRVRSKLNLKIKLKHGSAIFLVALTASLTIIIATHALALLVATPSVVTAVLELGSSSRRLAGVVAKLDAAAKGTYILSRDLETISRVVSRVNDELEDMNSSVKKWVERGDVHEEASWLHGINEAEVARQWSKISNHLDDLEEHLYLCFMNINRARNRVLKDILDPDQSMWTDPNILLSK